MKGPFPVFNFKLKTGNGLFYLLDKSASNSALGFGLLK